MPEKRCPEQAAEDTMIYARKTRLTLEEEFIHDLRTSQEFENAKRRRFKLEPSIAALIRAEKPLIE